MLFGGGNSAAKREPAIGAFKVMSQGYGVTIPVVMGTQRIQCVLIDYMDFYSVAHEQSSGGKGGGGGGGSYSYTYYATVLLLACQAPSFGVTYKRLWVNKDISATPTAKGLTEFEGGTGQAEWAYLSTKHPDHAAAYQGFAYLAAHDYELTSSASIGNHGVEVEGYYASQGAGKDAAIADCITGVLLNEQWGLDFGSERLLSLAQADAYCAAYGLVISPALTEQKPANELLAQWLKIGNLGAVWSQNAAGDAGALKILPLSQAAYGTYSPIAPLDIVLGDDDFLDDGDADPLVVQVISSAEAHNSLVVEFKSRSNEYNKVASPPASDAASISRYGLRKADAFVADEITTMSVARKVAQQLLQRQLYAPNRYEGRLSSWQYAYLEPGDVLSVRHDAQGITERLVMIESISDDGDAMSITFMDVLEAVGHVETYAADDVVYQRVPWNTPVGNIAPPVIFHAPAALSIGGYEVWIAVAHSDPRYGGCQIWGSFSGEDYKMLGTLNGMSTLGVLAADFASGTDPDTNPAHALRVDLSASNSALANVSHEAAKTMESLCLVGSEFIAYRDAHRDGAVYDLTAPYPLVVTAAATTVVNAAMMTFATLYRDSEYFNGGSITCIAGDAANVGQSRTISSYTHASGVKTVVCGAFPVLPTAGDQFELRALPYLRRGLFGTTKGATTGERFVRCDQHIFRFKFTAKDVGRILHFKFLSYNEHGQGVQSLADVDPYTIVLSQPPAGSTPQETYYQWVND